MVRFVAVFAPGVILLAFGSLLLLRDHPDAGGWSIAFGILSLAGVSIRSRDGDSEASS